MYDFYFHGVFFQQYIYIYIYIYIWLRWNFCEKILFLLLHEKEVLLRKALNMKMLFKINKILDTILNIK